MIRIVFVITGLNMGGAETMFYRLLAVLDRDRFTPEVVSLSDEGVYGTKIRSLNIPIHSLGMRSGIPSPWAFFRLVDILRRIRPAVIQTWMYHADLIGGLAGLVVRVPVIWGIRNYSLDPAFVKEGTIRVARLNARLSKRIPQKVVVCSDGARRQHVGIGYDPGKFVTIPNGYNLDQFRPAPPARSSLRHELGLDPNAFLIGLVARFDPLKDHQTFIKAAAIFLGQFPDTHFVLCGSGISLENAAIVRWIDAAGVRAKFHLLGFREDVPYIMAGLDINTLSSVGEAFPNVLGEAMACGIPCVTTDVGDAAEIVGDTGIVVQPGDPQALARGWDQLIELTVQERVSLGERARERIHSLYDIHQIAKQYEALYASNARTG